MRLPRSSVSSLVATVSVAEILGMAPFAMFLALQPQLREEWLLSNTAAGWISAAYYAGYMVAVPMLVSLTDRVDARTVWLASTTLAAAVAIGFGLIAGGVWSALVCQFLAGASLAGTYMPGLKLIADRMAGVPHPRFVAVYTTSFTVGSSLSFYAIDQLAQVMTWRQAVVAGACGPAIAWLLVFIGLERVRPRHDPHAPSIDHWREITRSADVRRYVLAYACHMWELFAFRSWLVPFFVFCESLRGATFAGAGTLAALVALVGIPSSIAGAELSARRDRRRLVVAIMLASAAASVLVGPTSLRSWAVIVTVSVAYGALVGADSAALTSGIVAVSPHQSRGTAMALYSMAGFAAASAGASAIGALLDLLGGQSVWSWTVAFAMMGASNVVGAVLLNRRSG
jgi:predicted MFS family arabinose efflux permease